MSENEKIVASILKQFTASDGKSFPTDKTFTDVSKVAFTQYVNQSKGEISLWLYSDRGVGVGRGGQNNKPYVLAKKTRDTYAKLYDLIVNCRTTEVVEDEDMFVVNPNIFA